jgi:beta-glucosidase
VNQISMVDMSMTSFPGRTYRHFTGEAVFPFGFGLSYTTFNYELVAATAKVRTCREQKNERAGCVLPTLEIGLVIFRYLHFFLSRKTQRTTPMSQLFAFEKVHLEAGESKELIFAAKLAALRCVRTRYNKLSSLEGRYAVKIGDLEHEFRHASGVLNIL